MIAAATIFGERLSATILAARTAAHEIGRLYPPSADLLQAGRWRFAIAGLGPLPKFELLHDPTLSIAYRRLRPHEPRQPAFVRGPEVAEGERRLAGLDDSDTTDATDDARR